MCGVYVDSYCPRIKALVRDSERYRKSRTRFVLFGFWLVKSWCISVVDRYFIEIMDRHGLICFNHRFLIERTTPQKPPRNDTEFEISEFGCLL